MKCKSMGGFTLAEVLIVITGAAIIGTILITIMVQSSNIFTNQNTQVTQNLALNNINTELSQTIRFASQIASNFAQGSDNYSSGTNQIVIKTPSIDNQKNIIDNKTDTIIYLTDPNDQKLLKKMVFPDPASSRPAENSILNSHLENLQFRYLNDSNVETNPVSATKVEFEITLGEKSAFTNKTNSLSGKVNLKNLP